MPQQKIQFVGECEWTKQNLNYRQQISSKTFDIINNNNLTYSTQSMEISTEHQATENDHHSAHSSTSRSGPIINCHPYAYVHQNHSSPPQPSFNQCELAQGSLIKGAHNSMPQTQKDLQYTSAERTQYRIKQQTGVKHSNIDVQRQQKFNQQNSASNQKIGINRQQIQRQLNQIYNEASRKDQGNRKLKKLHLQLYSQLSDLSRQVQMVNLLSEQTNTSLKGVVNVGSEFNDKLSQIHQCSSHSRQSMGAILNITNQIGELIKSSRVSIGCNLTASKQSEVPISSNNVSAIENFTNKTGSEPIIMIFQVPVQLQLLQQQPDQQSREGNYRQGEEQTQYREGELQGDLKQTQQILSIYKQEILKQQQNHRKLVYRLEREVQELKHKYKELLWQVERIQIHGQAAYEYEEQFGHQQHFTREVHHDMYQIPVQLQFIDEQYRIKKISQTLANYRTKLQAKFQVCSQFNEVINQNNDSCSSTILVQSNLFNFSFNRNHNHGAPGISTNPSQNPVVSKMLMNSDQYKQSLNIQQVQQQIQIKEYNNIFQIPLHLQLTVQTQQTGIQTLMDLKQASQEIAVCTQCQAPQAKSLSSSLSQIQLKQSSERQKYKQKQVQVQVQVRMGNRQLQKMRNNKIRQVFSFSINNTKLKRQPRSSANSGDSKISQGQILQINWQKVLKKRKKRTANNSAQPSSLFMQQRKHSNEEHQLSHQVQTNNLQHNEQHQTSEKQRQQLNIDLKNMNNSQQIIDYVTKQLQILLNSSPSSSSKNQEQPSHSKNDNIEIQIIQNMVTKQNQKQTECLNGRENGRTDLFNNIGGVHPPFNDSARQFYNFYEVENVIQQRFTSEQSKSKKTNTFNLINKPVQNETLSKQERRQGQLQEQDIISMGQKTHKNYVNNYIQDRIQKQTTDKQKSPIRNSLVFQLNSDQQASRNKSKLRLSQQVILNCDQACDLNQFQINILNLETAKQSNVNCELNRQNLQSGISFGNRFAYDYQNSSLTRQSPKFKQIRLESNCKNHAQLAQDQQYAHTDQQNLLKTKSQQQKNTYINTLIKNLKDAHAQVLAIEGQTSSQGSHTHRQIQIKQMRNQLNNLKSGRVEKQQDADNKLGQSHKHIISTQKKGKKDQSFNSMRSNEQAKSYSSINYKKIKQNLVDVADFYDLKQKKQLLEEQKQNLLEKISQYESIVQLFKKQIVNQQQNIQTMEANYKAKLTQIVNQINQYDQKMQNLEVELKQKTNSYQQMLNKTNQKQKILCEFQKQLKRRQKQEVRLYQQLRHLQQSYQSLTKKSLQQISQKDSLNQWLQNEHNHLKQQYSSQMISLKNIIKERDQKIEEFNIQISKNNQLIENMKSSYQQIMKNLEIAYRERENYIKMFQQLKSSVQNNKNFQSIVENLYMNGQNQNEQLGRVYESQMTKCRQSYNKSMQKKCIQIQKLQSNVVKLEGQNQKLLKQTSFYNLLLEQKEARIKQLSLQLAQIKKLQMSEQIQRQLQYLRKQVVFTNEELQRKEVTIRNQQENLAALQKQVSQLEQKIQIAFNKRANKQKQLQLNLDFNKCEKIGVKLYETPNSSRKNRKKNGESQIKKMHENFIKQRNNIKKRDSIQKCLQINQNILQNLNFNNNIMKNKRQGSISQQRLNQQFQALHTDRQILKSQIELQLKNKFELSKQPKSPFPINLETVTSIITNSMPSQMSSSETIRSLTLVNKKFQERLKSCQSQISQLCLKLTQYQVHVQQLQNVILNYEQILYANQRVIKQLQDKVVQYLKDALDKQKQNQMLYKDISCYQIQINQILLQKISIQVENKRMKRMINNSEKKLSAIGSKIILATRDKIRSKDQFAFMSKRSQNSTLKLRQLRIQ